MVFRSTSWNVCYSCCWIFCHEIPRAWGDVDGLHRCVLILGHLYRYALHSLVLGHARRLDPDRALFHGHGNLCGVGHYDVGRRDFWILQYVYRSYKLYLSFESFLIEQLSTPYPEYFDHCRYFVYSVHSFAAWPYQKSLLI